MFINSIAVCLNCVLFIDGGVVQDGHKDFRAIDGIMSKTLKEILD